MKKKIFLIVSLCMLVFGLSACGEDPKKVDYNGVSYDELKSNSEYLASTIVALKDDEIDNFVNQEMDSITLNLVKKWKELKGDVGDYVELGEFSVDKSGKTLTTTHIMDFTERDLTLTCVYNYLDMQVSDITLDENYSLGEKMQNAAMNTLMGLGTVFGILILISIIIWSFKFINAAQERAKAGSGCGRTGAGRLGTDRGDFRGGCGGCSRYAGSNRRVCCPFDPQKKIEVKKGQTVQSLK